MNESFLSNILKSNKKARDLLDSYKINAISHCDKISSISPANIKTYIISGSQDATIHVWTSSNFRQKHILQGHKSSITSTLLTSTNQLIISSSSDSTIRFWNLLHKTCDILRDSSPITCLSLSPCETFLVSGSDDWDLSLWDISEILSKHEKGLLNPKRKLLGKYLGHVNSITSSVITSDNTYLISAAMDALIIIWDFFSRKEKHRLKGHSTVVTSISVSSDSLLLLSGSWDTTVRLWCVPEATQVTLLGRHNFFVSGVALVQARNLAISASLDQIVKAWDLRTKLPEFSVDICGAPVTGIAVSHDQAYLVCAAENNLMVVWDLVQRKVCGGMKGHCRSIRDAEEGRECVITCSDDSSIRVWSKGQRVQIGEMMGHKGSVLKLALDNKGRYLVSAGTDKTLRLWDLCEYSEMFKIHSQAEFSSIAFSKCERYFIGCFHDCSIIIWRISINL